MSVAARTSTADAKLTVVRTLALARASGAGRRAHIAAASGLVSVGGFRYVIADDELHLGVFSRNGRGEGTLVRVRAGTLPTRPKPRK